MELIRILLVAIFFIMETTNTLAALKNSSYSKLQSKMQQQTKKVAALREQVMEVENALASQNKKYISDVNKAEQLEVNLQGIHEHLQNIEIQMKTEKEKITVILKNYMARSLDDSSSGHDLYLDRMMVRGVFKKRDRYKQLKHDFFTLKSEANLLSKRVGEYRENEQSLRAFIIDLENDKERMTKDFLDHKDILRKLQGKLAKKKTLLQGQKTRERPKKKVPKFGPVVFKMQGPLRSFLSMKRDKNRKGVLYRFKDKTPFYSGYRGRVQYLGRLANYGNLIIINHGRNIRSVLLGDINPKVKKGQQVGQGEIIGYTSVSKGRRGQLYFEIRVKNLAHNTLKWIDRSSLQVRKI